jgi:hypothetical protein
MSRLNEQVIVKHQIDVEVSTFGADALLAGNESKPLTQLKQKTLELLDQGLLKSGFQDDSGIG